MANELLIPKIGPVQPQREIGSRSPVEKGGPDFENLLRDSLSGGPRPDAAAPGGLKFSAHAMSRIKDRSISMGGELMQKLEKAGKPKERKTGKCPCRSGIRRIFSREGILN